MPDKVTKLVGSFLTRAKKTSELATEKLIEGGITITKKQLDTLQTLDKKTKNKTKTDKRKA